MDYTDKFNGVPLWNLIAICVIVGALGIWEGWGAAQFHREGLTITYCVRSFPLWMRWLGFAILVPLLGWHLVWYDSAWWKSLCNLVKG